MVNEEQDAVVHSPQRPIDINRDRMCSPAQPCSPAVMGFLGDYAVAMRLTLAGYNRRYLQLATLECKKLARRGNIGCRRSDDACSLRAK